MEALDADGNLIPGGAQIDITIYDRIQSFDGLAGILYMHLILIIVCIPILYIFPMLDPKVCMVLMVVLDGVLHW